MIGTGTMQFASAVGEMACDTEEIYTYVLPWQFALQTTTKKRLAYSTDMQRWVTIDLHGVAIYFVRQHDSTR